MKNNFFFLCMYNLKNIIALTNTTWINSAIIPEALFNLSNDKILNYYANTAMQQIFHPS